MGNMKTPGVYIVEKNAFPNSVVEAATAIPAFIGITEKAQNGSESLLNKPWKISSMTEFMNYFGGAPKMKFEVDIEKYDPVPTKKDDGTLEPRAGMTLKPKAGIFQYTIELKEKEAGIEQEVTNGYAFGIGWKQENGKQETPLYTLYYNLLLFFANGGGTCYIVSIGNYDDKNQIDEKDQSTKNYKVEDALSALEKIQEVTMIVVPELVNAGKADYQNIQQKILSHCGLTMKNRFALLDVYPKESSTTTTEQQIEAFQSGIGSEFLSYGAAYFPWLNTSVVADRDIEGNMFSWTAKAYSFLPKFSQVDPNLEKIVTAFQTELKIITIVAKTGENTTIQGKEYEFGDITLENLQKDLDKNMTVTVVSKPEVNPTEKTVTISYPYDIADKNGCHLALFNVSPLYQAAMKALKKCLNLLPPSAAMAGIYTMVDNSRGVWKAPANVSVSYVESVAEEIDDEHQADLNAPMNGKAINVIRPFQGEGIKVWGARTLDANSLDWRYVNVRRTLLFLEESVKNAARAYVFEPNDSNTWLNMRCMIENFLNSVWKRGGLAGASPEDAFSVHVGLGDTMTANDILDGIMRITVLVAVTHPAEFIEITFQQKMQES